MTREEAAYLINNLRSVAEGKEDEAIDMAIEALSVEETSTLSEKHQLSQETSTNTPTDYISRVDAFEAVQDHFNADGFKGYFDGQKMMDRIKALPSAEAKWIPVSERLPECGFGLHYLVTLKDGHVFKDDVYEAFFGKNGWHIGDNELADDEIIAWMPLPMPWREDGE